MLIKVKINGESAMYDIRQKTSITGELKIQFDFKDTSWDDYKIRTALFSKTNAPSVPVALDSENQVTVPNSMLKAGGFAVGVVGYNNGETLQTNSVQITIPVSSYFMQGIRKPDEDFFLQFLDQYDLVIKEIKIAEDSRIDSTEIDEDGHLIVTYADGTVKDMGMVKGEKGDTGEQGIQGIRGEQGIQGIQGIPGEKGEQGETGATGQTGAAGKDGVDGVSPTVATSKVGKTTTITFTDASGTHTATIVDGNDGQPGAEGQPGTPGAEGQPGTPGVSPTVSVSKVGKVTTVTITDVNGTHTATINDGNDGAGSGDMSKAVYDTNNNGVVDNAEKVNNHTVEKDVPSNAKFTDTVYDDTSLANRVSTIEGKEAGWDANTSARHTHSNKTFLDTLTGLKTINGNSLIGSGDLEIEGGGGAFVVTVTMDENWENVVSQDKTYNEILQAYNDGKPIICRMCVDNSYYEFLSLADYDVENGFSFYKDYCALGDDVFEYSCSGIYIDDDECTSSYRKSSVPFEDISANTSARHTHDNKSVLDGITSAKVSNWDTSYSNNHTHSNKNLLDTITGFKTINNNSIIGEGNINIEGGGGSSDSGYYFVKIDMCATEPEIYFGHRVSGSAPVLYDEMYDMYTAIQDSNVGLSSATIKIFCSDDTTHMVMATSYTWDYEESEMVVRFTGYDFENNSLEASADSIVTIHGDGTYDVSHPATYTNASGVSF